MFICKVRVQPISRTEFTIPQKLLYVRTRILNKGLELLTCNSSINLVGQMKYMIQGNLSKGIDRKTLCLHIFSTQ